MPRDIDIAKYEKSCDERSYGDPFTDEIDDEIRKEQTLKRLKEDMDLIKFAVEEPWKNANNNEGPTYQAMLQALAGIKQICGSW